MNSHPDGRCPDGELCVACALYALEPAEQAQLDQHLVQCRQAREAVRDAEEIAGLLGLSVTQTDPPSDLRVRILSQASRTAQRGTARHHRTTPRHRTAIADRSHQPSSAQPVGRRHWGRLLTMVGAFLVAVAGGVAGSQVAQTQQLDEINRNLQVVADSAARRVELLAPDGQPAAVAYLERNTAVVLPASLPANDTRHETYVLWAIVDGGPAALGTFDIVAAGRPTSVTGAARNPAAAGYAISVEPGRSAPAAPTRIVAAS